MSRWSDADPATDKDPCLAANTLSGPGQKSGILAAFLRIPNTLRPNPGPDCRVCSCVIAQARIPVPPVGEVEKTPDSSEALPQPFPRLYRHRQAR